eukprot:TRINITY_DN350_c0_g1_i2.p1 TRINITY_DN350_c0_g1~~TRINITY_DN350_c0_g1_i2.p1  ORF type:complete len:542 (+),score=40.25 TRINITY_DN350_c0_g1_i2:124-1749(+)
MIMQIHLENYAATVRKRSVNYRFYQRQPQTSSRCTMALTSLCKLHVRDWRTFWMIILPPAQTQLNLYQMIANIRTLKMRHLVLGQRIMILLCFLLQKSVQSTQSCKASGVHTALTGVENEMRITWTTPSKNCTSQVLYGILGTPDEYLQLETGEIDQYRPSDMCSKPATQNDFPKFYIHTVILKDLEASERYYYTIPADQDFPDTTFYTPHPVSPKTSTHFIAVGDTGEHVIFPENNPGSQMNFDRMRQTDFEKYRMVMHVGDLSYADGTPSAWPTFMDLIEPVAKRVPYMIAIGNHEFDYSGQSSADPSGVSHYQPSWGDFDNDSGGECGVPTLKHFPMQKKGELDNPPFWYSFDYGSVHIITLSTEHSLSPKHEQYEFLQHDLANVDRCGRTPWIIVQMHRPIYIIPNSNNYKVSHHIRKHIEQLLLDNKVDLVIGGHEHVYYHTCAVANEKCVNADIGIVSLVIGNGGRELKQSFAELIEQKPVWYEKGKLEYGYALFDIQGGSNNMKVTIMGAKYGETIDEFHVMNKNKNWCGAQEQ